MLNRTYLLWSVACFLACLLCVPVGSAAWAWLADPDRPTLVVPSVDDFELNGDGSNEAWSKADWTTLSKRSGELDYDAKLKILRSATGIYVLFEGTDERITATHTDDFEDLWKEDVFEVFLWTDERHPVYFEYEISPLGAELPILVPNFDGRFLGWRPWHYEGDRRTRRATSAIGGELLPGAKVAGWRAEIFLPFDLFRPLLGVPPEPGSTWRANFYRVDHDGERTTAWDWARVGPSFHDYRSFGVLKFQ